MFEQIDKTVFIFVYGMILSLMLPAVMVEFIILATTLPLLIKILLEKAD